VEQVQTPSTDAQPTLMSLIKKQTIMMVLRFDLHRSGAPKSTSINEKDSLHGFRGLSFIGKILLSVVNRTLRHAHVSQPICYSSQKSFVALKHATRKYLSTLLLSHCSFGTQTGKSMLAFKWIFSSSGAFADF
jgi:hypothetical protein